MLRAKTRAFAPLCNLTVEDLVPADHFYALCRLRRPYRRYGSWPLRDVRRGPAEGGQRLRCLACVRNAGGAA
jgi:hypothetical protein